MQKNFILDTNVILHDSQAIYKFQDNTVIIPITVIEELDHFKKEMNELGRNARHFSRQMDELRKQGSLTEGVTVGESIVRVAFCTPASLECLPADMDNRVADNKILAISLFTRNNTARPTVLVTKDANVRIKADALGLVAEDYNNDKVDIGTLYKGWSEHYTIPDTSELHTNEYVKILDSEGNTERILRYDSVLNELVPLREDLESWGLSPKNEEQMCAMDALLNPDIKLITIVGQAGTGKGLVSLSTALRQVTDEFLYKKLLVAKPVMPMGKDIGFLPGSIDEKLNPYMQSIYDGIEFLMFGNFLKSVKVTKKHKKTKSEEEKEAGLLNRGHLELQAAGILEVEPLLYIRGRSIPNVIMLLDEVQNMNKHEIKTVITRASEGTKIICVGDPAQIDSPYLDSCSNGLTYLAERFKSESIAAHITLTKGERSELAEIASNIL